MSPKARQIAIFGAGLSLGLAAAWMVMSQRSAPVSDRVQEPEKTPVKAPAAGPAAPPAAAAAAPATATTAATAAAGTGPAREGTAARAACPSQPIAAVAGPKDGQYQLAGDLGARAEKDMAAFIVVGKEAAASGRNRDAEVAFMMSCRVADALKGAASLEAADAKYQLGWLYANLGLHSPAANRTELQKRAELMYADSLQTYRARHGEAHEKTRFASEGLASLGQAPPPTAFVAATKGQEPAPATRAAPEAAPAGPKVVAAAPGTTSERRAPAAPPTTARSAPPTAVAAPGPARAAPSPATAPAGVALRGDPPPPARSGTATGEAYDRRAEETLMPPAQQPAGGSATAIRPSFDCAKARSQPEKLICADPELARMDRELGRLYARARDAAPDAGAFRRQQDQAWREREANCRDRDCLVRWYAQRRGQLNAALAQSRP